MKPIIYDNFDTFESAEKFASENNGNVVLLHKKCGEHEWRGINDIIYELPELDLEDYVEAREMYTKSTTQEELAQQCFETLDGVIDFGVTLDEMSHYVEIYKEIWEKLQNVDDKTAVVWYFNEKIEKETYRPMYWTDGNSVQHKVGVVVLSEED